MGLLPKNWAAGRDREIVRAKSGTMHYANGLAGYMATRSGRRLGFVLMLTDFARRAALDAAFDSRIASVPAGAKVWAKRAKQFERALVRAWLEHY